MSQETSPNKHRTVISSSHPLTITVNVPPKTVIPVQHTVIPVHDKPSPSPPVLPTPQSPQPLLPRIPTTFKKVKFQQIKSFDDANAYIANRDKVPQSNMKILFQKKHLCETSIGVSDIYKIGHFLWLFDDDSHIDYMQINSKFTKKKQFQTKKPIWQKELQKYKTVQDAFDNINKNLGDKQFNYLNKNTILFDVIAAIKQPITNIIPIKDNKKQLSKKKKKKSKSKSTSLDKIDTHIDRHLSINNDYKKRKLQELNGFVDYGIICGMEPPIKKQKLNNINCNVNSDKNGKQEVEDISCFNCAKKLGENDKYRCSVCKIAWYCGSECQIENWKTHEKECKMGENNKDINDDIIMKIENKHVDNWNWYEIIYWLNRCKYGRFNNIKYLNLRKHLYIGKIKGYQLKSINHITLNMIGINDYNSHMLILDAFAELLMEEDMNNISNNALNMFKNDNIDIPMKYLDPISYELMCEPMICKNKKINTCYEWKCIQKYVKQYGMDPLMQQTVTLKEFVKHDALKNEIDEWKQKHLSEIMLD
eukprot:219711_1